MSEFKNMKILITPEQPLDEVVVELKRIGYMQDFYAENPRSIEAYSDGTFDCYCFNQDADTTLSELKEMKL